jgi:hypothetical protein
VSTSDWTAAASLGVSLVALVVSLYAIQRANKTASAATLVTLNEGFRQAWTRFLNSREDEKSYELAELMNLFEIACAIYVERSLTGNSRELMFEYIDGVLNVLVKNTYTNENVAKLLQSKTNLHLYKKIPK